MRHLDLIRVEEYKFLRQEHENNRKFIFERPLVIVLGMTASFLGFKGSPDDSLAMLPLLFLAVLWFNLWFTHNRMRSSARIVTYIQLLHESRDNMHMLGWENALSKFRGWMSGNRDRYKEIVADAKEADSMGFYLYIFHFHLLSGALFMLLVLLHCGTLQRAYAGGLEGLDRLWLATNGAGGAAFATVLMWKYSPVSVRKAISASRRVWLEVFDSVGTGH